MVVARVSTGTEATRQAMVTVDSDCLATNTHMRADYRCSKTQAGGDADSSVVHLVANTVQWQSFKPVTGAGRTSSQQKSADDMIQAESSSISASA